MILLINSVHDMSSEIRIFIHSYTSLTYTSILNFSDEPPKPSWEIKPPILSITGKLKIICYPKYLLIHNIHVQRITDRLSGQVVRVPGYRSRGPGSIPGATRFSEKG
jgi:hypothetical protein